MMTSPVEAMRQLFLFDERPNLPPRYNIAPSQDVPVVRLKRDRSGRELAMVRWGLVPSWADDPKIGYRLINARAESVAKKPAFRDAFKKRRCLVPANGFYEWEKRDGGKQPWLIRAKGGALLAFAGLWEIWRPPDGEPLQSCTIVTCAPNALAGRFHNRMPVILDAADHERWLSGEPEEASTLLGPCPDDRLEAWPVSPQVNSPKHDDANLITPLTPPAHQDELFKG